MDNTATRMVVGIAGKFALITMRDIHAPLEPKPRLQKLTKLKNGRAL